MTRQTLRAAWNLVKSRSFQRTTLLGAALLMLLWGYDAVKITDFLDGLTKIGLSLLALDGVIHNERGEG